MNQIVSSPVLKSSGSPNFANNTIWTLHHRLWNLILCLVLFLRFDHMPLSPLFILISLSEPWTGPTYSYLILFKTGYLHMLFSLPGMLSGQMSHPQRSLLWPPIWVASPLTLELIHSFPSFTTLWLSKITLFIVDLFLSVSSASILLRARILSAVSSTVFSVPWTVSAPVTYPNHATAPLW